MPVISETRTIRAWESPSSDGLVYDVEIRQDGKTVYAMTYSRASAEENMQYTWGVNDPAPVIDEAGRSVGTEIAF